MASSKDILRFSENKTRKTLLVLKKDQGSDSKRLHMAAHTYYKRALPYTIRIEITAEEESTLVTITDGKKIMELEYGILNAKKLILDILLIWAQENGRPNKILVDSRARQRSLTNAMKKARIRNIRVLVGNFPQKSKLCN